MLSVLFQRPFVDQLLEWAVAMQPISKYIIFAQELSKLLGINSCTITSVILFFHKVYFCDFMQFFSVHGQNIVHLLQNLYFQFSQNLFLSLLLCRYVRDLLGPITNNLATLSKHDDLQALAQQPEIVMQVRWASCSELVFTCLHAVYLYLVCYHL